MRGLPVLVCSLLLAGCLGGSQDGAPASPDLPPDLQALTFTQVADVLVPCTGCFEPAAAVDSQGRIYAAAHRLENVAVSTDGGTTFVVKQVPDPPSPLSQAHGASDDEIQVAPWGDVYYTELWSDSGGVLGSGVHIAGSPDGGDTWPVNVFVQARNMPTSAAFISDRQWLAFHGDKTVYLVFNCALSSLICLMESDDRGMTWSESRPVVLAVDHSFPSPAGFPAVGSDGTLLVPYFSDPRADGQVGARSIRVATSTDGGRSFKQTTAYTSPLESGANTGGGWPEGTILTDGSWVTSWSDTQDTLWTSVSHDLGATWKTVTTPNSATGGPVYGHPFLRPNAGGGFDGVWFGTDNVTAGRFDNDGNLLGLAVVPANGGGHSDYPFFDHAPDGRIVTPFITPDGNGLRVAITNI